MLDGQSGIGERQTCEGAFTVLLGSTYLLISAGFLFFLKGDEEERMLSRGQFSKLQRDTVAR